MPPASLPDTRAQSAEAARCNWSYAALSGLVLNSLPLRQWPGFYKQPDFMRFNDLARQVDVRNITPQYWSIHAKLEETQTQMTTNWSPRRFASSYFAAQAKAGEIPTQVGLVKAAQRAGLKGRREELRKEFKDWHRRAGRVMRRGSPQNNFAKNNFAKNL